MPRFEFRVSAGADCWERANQAINRRFPEVAVVERRRSTTTDEEAWICRAPSRAHLQQWMKALGMESTQPELHSESASMIEPIAGLQDDEERRPPS